MKIPDAFRQSLVGTFDDCALATRFELEGHREWSSKAQARGTIFHSIAEEILRTLHRQGENAISTQEAIEVAYEVMAQRDVPAGDVVVLDADERAMLIRTVLMFAGLTWDDLHIVGLEKRLTVPIKCEDGKTRTFTGKLDLLAADPPGGAIVVDFKTGWGSPKDSRGPEEPVGKQYLSERGHFQLDAYGLLVMGTYPSIDHVTLREFHVMTDAVREATLTRDELEHVTRELGVQMELLERAMTEGAKSKLWKPTPGKHCQWCCRPSGCPIAAAERGEGAVETPEMAAEWAEGLVAASASRDNYRKALKAYVDETGAIVPAGRNLAVGWRVDDKNGRRAFGIYPRATLEDQRKIGAATP
jgi:hypothetical protein